MCIVLMLFSVCLYWINCAKLLELTCFVWISIIKWQLSVYFCVFRYFRNNLLSQNSQKSSYYWQWCGNFFLLELGVIFVVDASHQLSRFCMIRVYSRLSKGQAVYQINNWPRCIRFSFDIKMLLRHPSHFTTSTSVRLHSVEKRDKPAGCYVTVASQMHLSRLRDKAKHMLGKTTESWLLCIRCPLNYYSI